MKTASKINVKNNLTYSQHYRLGKKIKPLLFERQGAYCWYCEKDFSFESLTVEHVIPRSEGGDTSLENCVLACIHCNARREDFPPPNVWKAYIRLKEGLKTKALELNEKIDLKDKDGLKKYVENRNDLYMIYPSVKKIPNLFILQINHPVQISELCSMKVSKLSKNNEYDKQTKAYLLEKIKNFGINIGKNNLLRFRTRSLEFKIIEGKSKITGGWILFFLLKDCVIVSPGYNLNGRELSKNDMLVLNGLTKIGKEKLN